MALKEKTTQLIKDVEDDGFPVCPGKSVEDGTVVQVVLQVLPV